MSKLAVVAALAGVVALGAGLGILAFALLVPRGEPATVVAVGPLTPLAIIPTVAPPPPARRSGKVEVSLGRRPFDFGTQGQSRELLALMDQQTGKAVYSIGYATTGDIVALTCNFTTDTLVRMHRESTGKGSSEVWIGHVLYRVQSGTRGGSLNDTPTGKDLARTDYF